MRVCTGRRCGRLLPRGIRAIGEPGRAKVSGLEAGSGRGPWGRFDLRLVPMALAIFGGAEAGHLLSFPESSFATWWPPNGILAALLLLEPRARWAAVLLAALPPTLASDLLHQTPVWASLSFWLGDCTEAMCAAWFFRRWISRSAGFARISDVLGFCAVTTLVATPIGGVIGSATLALLPGARSAASDWLLWWTADAVGMLVAAPLVLAWRGPLDPKERARWRAEGPVALGCLALICHAIFSLQHDAAAQALQMPYLVLPFVIWPALRLRVRGAALASAVVAVIATWHTIHGHGPFVGIGRSVTLQATLLQAFLVVVACTSLALGASARERASSESLLRKSEEGLRELFDSVHDLIQATSLDGRFELVNRAWLENLRWPVEVVPELKLDDIVHPDHRSGLSEAVHRVLTGEDVGIIESVFVTRDGREIAVEGRATFQSHAERPPAIRWVFRDVTARRRLEAQRAEESQRLKRAYLDLAEIALTDPLTGLRNRRAFEDELERELPRSERAGSPLSLLIVDVDHFKDFNDAFGHPAGDEALRTVAQLLRDNARRSDSVARIGGEEFAVILPESDVEGALALAERFRLAVELAPWARRPITVSIGVATLGLGVTRPMDLIRDADRALYHSKDRGRNVVTHAARAMASSTAPLA